MFVNIWMTEPVITVAPTQMIGEALDLLKNNRIRRLPVVENDILVGILSPGDIERVLPSSLDSEGEKEYDFVIGNTEIKTVMTLSPVTVKPEDTLVCAARRMRRNKIDGLPVVEDGRLAGIISITNVLDAFLEIMATEKEGTRFDLKIDQEPKSFYRMIKAFRRCGKEIVAITQHYGFSPEAQLVTIQTSDGDNEELIDHLWKEGVTVELVTPVRNN